MKSTISPISFLLIAIAVAVSCKADEGMWMPSQLKMKEALLKQFGLKIPVEEIYSNDSASLKDAVVLFGGGCTGEVISSQGLVLTNHHCGLSQIQALSSLEHNFVENGFWALNKKDELPCTGLSVTFIDKIIPVTDKILLNIPDTLTSEEKDIKIAERIKAFEKEQQYAPPYSAKVRSFYQNNEFYLFVTITYKDIRLVGAPPSSIGKFGGDADNWIWPRHTGDFSLFRIYAGSDNLPADYSENNVPFIPKKYFTISTSGINENDLTMVYGFPGRTNQFLSSYAVEMLQNTTYPNRVKIRTEKLGHWKNNMESNDTVRLKYSAKYAGLSNHWKKWQGEIFGLKKTQAVEQKKEFEHTFIRWTSESRDRIDKYSGILHEMELHYTNLKPYSILNDYYSEAILGIEIFNFSASVLQNLDKLAANKEITDDSLKQVARNYIKALKLNFKNYDAKTDQQVMASMMKLYFKYVDPMFLPPYLSDIKNKYGNDLAWYSQYVFKKTRFSSENAFIKFLDEFNRKSLKKIRKDPAYELAIAFTHANHTNAMDEYRRINSKLNLLQNIYTRGQMELRPDSLLYPDANSTLRLAFGKVSGYQPRDAVSYYYQTTLSGAIEKYMPGDDEFDLPQSLLSLFQQKDLGRFAVRNDVPLAFLSSNHTTGGNSGSPVINGRGELIGTNFDRTWESTMSDIKFSESLCRNITLDIRYTLFVIEKIGNAENIINELTIR